MIRSLGSSLLAKSRPGSLSREMQQARITKPEIPGKGAVGTAVRGLTQETEIVPPAPGSEKIIKTAPGIESASLPGIAANQVPLVAGVGLPTLPSISPGAANQPMFQGAGAPASAQGQAGRQATVASTKGAPYGAVATARAARTAPQGEVMGWNDQGQVSPEAASTQYQAPRPNYTVGSFFPGIASLGGRVSAEGGGNQTIPKNFGQAIVATLSKPGSKGEAWGTNPKVTSSGVGSLSKPGATAKAIGNVVTSALRSVAQSAKNTVSNLRSKLFGRR